MSTVLCVLAAIWLLWVFYVAVMHLKHMRDDGHLTNVQKAFGYPTLIVGLVLDLVVHFVVGTVLFLELPAKKEWTLSARLWRLSNGDPGWRQRLALAIRTQLLDSADPAGVHKG